jgi:hypothetical protein
MPGLRRRGRGRAKGRVAREPRVVHTRTALDFECKRSVHAAYRQWQPPLAASV